MKNRRGQMTVEIVLMITVVVFAAVMVAKFFRDEEIFGNLVSGPWSRLAAMIQNGVWAPYDDSMVQHPNSFGRVSSVRGDPAQ